MKLSDGRPSTILIVEDLHWIRSSMKKSVEFHGYRAVEAADAAEAIAVAERESPALVLTEEELPTFGALMQHARDHPAFRNVPVVIINPDADDGARYGDAFLLNAYDDIAPLLASACE